MKGDFCNQLSRRPRLFAILNIVHSIFMSISKSQQIILANQQINYTIKKSVKARNIRISISCNKGLEVTLPFFVTQKSAEQFMYEKTNWILNKLKEAQSDRNIVLPKVRVQEFYKYKLKATELVNLKLEQHNQFYNFKYNRVCIRDQKTRWGSCSSQKNLNFNFKLVFLEDRLVDYIVVHELCHLKEMNHSRNFWSLVSRAMPDYRELRQDLKWIKM